MTVSDIAQLGVLAVTAVAVRVSLRGLRDQLWLQTFSEYTRRYVESIDLLPAGARRPYGEWDFSDLSDPIRQALVIAVRHYLNLCSEEFYLHSRRRIDADTWDVWIAGMRSTMRLPAFRDGWRLVGARVRSTTPNSTCS